MCDVDKAQMSGRRGQGWSANYEFDDMQSVCGGGTERGLDTNKAE